MMRRFLYLLAAIFGILALPYSCQASDRHHSGQSHARPNIVMIMTDDQDLLLNSLDYQPAVKKHFQDAGAFFEKHYCTIAICCPSRASLLTGKHAHNTNVTDVSAPYGGYNKFVAEGLNGHWLPSWFQQHSYSTYYVGKLMNGYSVSNYDKPYPLGFNGSDFLLDPGTYLYYNATMQSNKDPPRSLLGQYSTDVVAKRAANFMEKGAHSKDPFFLTITPIGPHSNTIVGGPSGVRFDPPVPAKRHQNLYRGVQVPRTDNYNPDFATGSSYIKKLPAWNKTVIDYYDEFYRLRLASLAAVDDLIDTVIEKAEQLGIDQNTYFIYTTDNGYHIGQHRLPAGKTCAIEEDINIPFFIRGPNIKKKVTIKSPTGHVDIAPTLFELAGIPQREDFDGTSMPIPWIENSKGIPSTGGAAKNKDNQHNRQEHVNVEFWGQNIGEGDFATSLLSSTTNNTYKALRLISEDSSFNLAYIVWCTNERELYDMNNDPRQLQNLATDFKLSLQASSIGPQPHSVSLQYDTAALPNSADGKYWYGNQPNRVRLQSRLDTLLMVLKTCKGAVCLKPWHTIHPDGSVNSLKDALAEKYDNFHLEEQPKIHFESCLDGYLRAFEGPGADQGDVKIWHGQA